MKRPASEQLRRFFSQFSSSDQVLIVINADPDAIASAMAVKRLLWRKVANVAIANVNVIKRPDNIAMIRLLGVKLTPTDEIDFSKYSRFVIVDSQPDHHTVFTKFQSHVIIDHHPDSGIKAPFVDIRPEYGATATILTEYLKSAKIKPSAKLATALFIAIKTDTLNFERKTINEDIRAFQFLFKHANLHLARKIEQSDLRLDFLNYFKKALNTLHIRKSKVFVHLGAVVNPDVCVLIADFFMRVNAIKWSVISGIFDKKLIVILRNDGLKKDAGNLAKQSFGHLGSAGGHKSAARAEILVEKIAHCVDIDDEKKISDFIIDRIEKKHKKPQVGFKKDILGIK